MGYVSLKSQVLGWSLSRRQSGAPCLGLSLDVARGRPRSARGVRPPSASCSASLPAPVSGHCVGFRHTCGPFHDASSERPCLAAWGAVASPSSRLKSGGPGPPPASLQPCRAATSALLGCLFVSGHAWRCPGIAPGGTWETVLDAGVRPWPTLCQADALPGAPHAFASAEGCARAGPLSSHLLD